MSPTGIDEARFELEICQHLVDEAGWDALKVGTGAEHRGDLDLAAGIDTAELFAFVEATQPREWARLATVHGVSALEVRSRFLARLVKELDARGTVDVLRHGVVDLGVSIRLASFRPAHGLTAALVQRYRANRLTVTRQVPHQPGSTRTLDLALFLNGLPVATAELKHHLTGQSIEDAKHQYRHDRDPAASALLRRAVVHFALDTEQVAMTTRLQGPTTRFLPWNLGRDGGAGNPANPDGHRSAYLWERLWEREAWLDVLARFVHVEQPTAGGGGTTIFPRVHQWDAVRALEAAARAEGPGHDYLVQHSAGSGKSNTIAWLAHRLATLHDDADRKVFDKVVVITDRRVLDQQLQRTIYQFEHAHGVVRKIDESSAQLAEALSGTAARIVITTLQKFPFVLGHTQGEAVPGTYAVIVDEAHSSQTGETAKELKVVLGGGSAGPGADLAEQELTTAELEDAGFAAEALDPVGDALARAAGARSRQRNLSFFAFTATPKGRTLELFGRRGPTGKHEPFHLYSMRQAVEEGFILDVLAGYVTYQTYWQIERALEDDPDLDPSKAKAAIARFVSLHPSNLAQKAEVIVEHYRRHVRSKIGGRAKAMVVTASRLHAVRYQRALKAYCDHQGYGELGVLVDFSGTVHDDGGDTTEAQLNGFPESQTAERFAGGDQHLLVVAEKYQTGFDQPLLYAMYVDKPLTGLAAVQTLARLNRTYERDGVVKDGTFVLDFRNDAEAVRDEFEPWYGRTVAPPTDPNLLYDTRRELDGHDVLREDEIEAVVGLLLTAQGRDTTVSGRVHSALGPAVDRVDALPDDERDRFRDALNRFVRIYSFLSQVVSFTDAKLERDHLYCRALAALVRQVGVGSLDLGSAVELTHLRTQQTFEGSVSLEAGDGEVSTVFSGAGPRRLPDEEPLSKIIQELNERFGTSFDPRDRVFFDVIADKLADRPDIQQLAVNNAEDAFGLVIEKEFTSGVVDQLQAAEDIALGYLDNPDMKAMVLEVWGPLLKRRATVAAQEHAPIGDLLGPDRESKHLEYKATLRTHADSGVLHKPLETAVVKTVAAFLNDDIGGTLLIGVADDATPVGLGSDYATLHKDGRDDRDLFELHLGNVLTRSLGVAATALVRAEIIAVDGHDIARVHVAPSGVPVEAVVTVETSAGLQKKTAFYVRVLNGTREITDPAERDRYVATRWPP